MEEDRKDETEICVRTLRTALLQNERHGRDARCWRNTN